jgi:ATP-dependent DNA helicase RecQ
MVEEPLIIGQKIVSCVARVRECFGADHIADVLKGNRTAAIERWGHSNLSTFSLMNTETKIFIRFMIEQLIGQGFLQRTGEFMTIIITPMGHQLLKGDIAPQLAKPVIAAKKKESEKKRIVRRAHEWQGVDQSLFDILRAKRAELARKKGVPAYIVFSDKTLKDMALAKPVTREQFAEIFGVGAAKQKDYGETFINEIIQYKKGNISTA